VTIGYASGTPTHNLDFQIVKPVLKVILKSYPQIELHLIGDLDPGEDWGQGAGQVKRLPLVPWRQLPGLLARLDINLAPLEVDNPFSQSKSEIKYVEAALVRTPTVASPTEAFSHAIRDGENGCLAGDARAWSQALVQLVEDAGLRRSLGEQAYAEVLRRYHPRARAAGLVAVLEEISVKTQGRPLWPADFPKQAAAPEANPSPAFAFRIDPQYEHRPSFLRMGLYDLRHRGLQTLLMRAWVFFRRLVAPIFPFKPVH
jgi:hypothetical protein